MATIEELRSEVERLTRELDLQSSEISQSAKYGLGLLEEKETLQHKCEELENLYEHAKSELDLTQEVSENCKNPRKILFLLPAFEINPIDGFS
jgi:protein bicaudal D